MITYNELMITIQVIVNIVTLCMLYHFWKEKMSRPLFVVVNGLYKVIYY